MNVRKDIYVDKGDLHFRNEMVLGPCGAEVRTFIVALKTVKAGGAKGGRKVNWFNRYRMITQC